MAKGQLPIRQIGALEVTVVGLGCNNFGGRVDEPGATRVVQAALDAGINFFDTADIYGGTRSEEILGRALGARRKDIVLTTKFGMPLDPQRRGAAPAYVKLAIEASLKRLNTDYLDLYQLHRPDADTPIADTLAALNDLVREGKVREIGCSNFSAAQLDEADAAARAGAARFVSVQNEYSLIRRDAELDVLPQCERLGIAFLPYFPLASGLLTGKYPPGTTPPAGGRFAPGGWSTGMFTARNLELVAALGQLAQAHGLTMLELAFSWLLRKPSVASVIAGAMTAEQVAANASAYRRPLSEDALAGIAKIVAAPA